jgi:DNA-binding MarR family transcriptional regulator
MSLIQEQIRQQRSFHSLEEEVFVGLQLVADRLMEPWARHLRDIADLTHVQYNVLRILRGAGADGLWAGDIAERLITRSPDVTRLVDRLEARGLVRRRRDSDDRRAVRVFITKAGLDRIAPLDRAARTMLAQHLGKLDETRLTELRDTLVLLLEASTAT